MNVYLAGGFRSGWQDIVINQLNGADLTFLDPRKHGLSAPSAYTWWDLNAIDKSDVVFAYLEDSNPGGYALCAEIGYARARGKQVIFINEKGAKYFEMIACMSDKHLTLLSEGIQELKYIVDAAC